MVYSNINSTIFYKEDGIIDDEDIGYETTLHEMEIYGKNVSVIFGKLKYQYVQRNIVYVPLYLVVHQEVVKKIGVLEFEKEKALEMYDDNNEIDLEKDISPLLFDFFDENYVDRNASRLLIDTQDKEAEDHSTNSDVDEDVKKDENDDVKEEDPENDTFLVKVAPSKISKETMKASHRIKDGIFERKTTSSTLSPLKEESEQDAAAQQKEYSFKPGDNWVQQYMKNVHYKIHDVERNGDCFFATVRDAYKQIGLITTVAKLRAIVAKEATAAIFKGHKQLYNDLQGTLVEYERELKATKTLIEKDLKVRAEKSRNNKDDLRLVMKEMELQKQKYKDLLRSKQVTLSMIEDDVGNYANIHNVEQFREYIQTSGFWADSWAIATLEKVLNMKVIILSERAYLENDVHNVLMCGDVHHELQNAGEFEPKQYIITSFSGNHFQLVTYKDKRIFEFYEIPYHIKTLTINKCLERNAGAFSLIPHFRDMKSKMGLDDDETESGSDIDENNEASHSSLYNKNIVFEFYRNSNNAAKPGKGTNEKISNEQRAQFIELSKIQGWRRMLDDSWTNASFEVDGKKWLSVEHYYQGAKFKKQNPDFYHTFSLDDHESPLAKDVDLAISAGSKSGRLTGKAKKKVKTDDTLLRPKHIDIDPDFYGERGAKERETALRAKFENNADLKNVLLLTRDALLVKYHHGAPQEKDNLLMALRRSLSN